MTLSNGKSVFTGMLLSLVLVACGGGGGNDNHRGDDNADNQDNEPPQAVDDRASTPRDTAVTIPVLDNDTDPDDDPLSVVGTRDPDHGTAEPTADGAIRYIPAAGSFGTDRFEYTVGDGRGARDTAAVVIDVLKVNRAPDAVDDALSIDEGGTAVIDPLANDSDPDGDPLTLTEVSGADHGQVEIEADGRLRYVPDAGFTGTDRFQYQVGDGDGGEGEATVEVDVAMITGLLERPANATCLAPPRPPTGADVALEPVFTDFEVGGVVALEPAPGDDPRWFAVQKGGQIMAFDPADPQSLQPFITITDRVEGRSEGGLYGIAFHADFEQNGQAFLSYTGPGNPLVSYVSRFSSADRGVTLDPASEQRLIILDQPELIHNGGDLGFGPDGYLYVGFGDGGEELRGISNATNGQDTHNLFAALLRIDVDGVDEDLGLPYGIPSDNPFASGVGGRPELYAWGFRNPWRWNFDFETGELWAGDVGTAHWEEINLVERGGNYGWSLKEGGSIADGEGHCWIPDLCESGDLIDPVHAYGREAGCAITGGYVYRGSAIPDLQGVYVYGDFCTGAVWGLFSDAEGRPDPRVLAETGSLLVSFAEDEEGELYTIAHGNWKVAKLVPGQPRQNTFPQRLSETGCFEASDPLQPAAGVIPYDVNTILWSDDADKKRWLALPDGEAIRVEDNGHWAFPVGSVLIKQFEFDGTPFETRLLVRHQDGDWGGYSYEWNDDLSDALLLPAGKTKTVAGVEWSYPSRSQCIQCHTEVGGRSLGPETAQLNGPTTYPSSGRTFNQVATYQHLDMLVPEPAEEPEQLPALPALDEENEPLERRARAYLHANCAYCHQPGGPGRGGADFRYATPVAEMGICDKSPETSNLGVEDARLVVPGAPEKSLIPLRMRATDLNRMPPLGTDLVDDAAVAVIEGWIASLEACP